MFPKDFCSIFKFKASICKHLQVVVFFLSIAVLNSCSEFRKWNHVPSASQTLRLGLGLFPVSHSTNYRVGLSLALGLIKRHGIQTVLTERWLPEKINIFVRMLSREKVNFFVQTKCSPFVFPPIIFGTHTGTHPQNLEAEMSPHIFVPFALKSLCHFPFAALKYLPNEGGDEDASQETTSRQKSRD